MTPQTMIVIIQEEVTGLSVFVSLEWTLFHVFFPPIIFVFLLSPPPSHGRVSEASSPC